MPGELKCAGVVGAGTMGAGIALLFAIKGHPVVLADKSQEALDAALPRIRAHTPPELLKTVEEKLRTTTELSSLSRCGLVIEAVYEDAYVKKTVLAELGRVCREDAVIATNTSSISIDELSEAVARPERFAGMHFMNPPKVMKLVEVVAGRKTSKETIEKILAAARDLGKVTTVVKDTPGFITNRLLFALLGEAMRLFEDNVASKEDIDIAMKHGMGHPMGPFELADFIGLDVCLDIMLYISQSLGDPKYAPPESLASLVKSGSLGKKTGRGFYDYA